MSTPYVLVNTLEEISMIAGTTKSYEYTVSNPDGTPFILSGYTAVTLVLAPFGQPSNNILQIDGTITGTNTFYFVLTSALTASLLGKYIQQPIIIGGGDIEVRMGQGIISIIPQIPKT